MTPQMQRVVQWESLIPYIYIYVHIQRYEGYNFTALMNENSEMVDFFFGMIPKVQVGNLVLLLQQISPDLSWNACLHFSVRHKRCPNENTSNNSKSTLPSICSVPFGALLRRRLRSSLKDSTHWSRIQSQERSIVEKYPTWGLFVNWVETTS